MKKVSHKIISSVALLSLVVACGKDSDKSSRSGTGAGSVEEEVAPVDGSNIDGHYQAKFITLNPHVNGTIPGSANFFRKEEKLFAYVRLFAGGVRAWHMQHVYTGGRCPTLSDDTNGDGFIDINEAEAVMGKILIPLDADISSQQSGRRFFPLADLSGYYHYERITSFRRFLQDLQEEDKDLTDDIVKLAPGEGLRIKGKTVLIQGVSEIVELPETVGTKGRHRPFQTLPIACGVFEKMEGIPGTPYAQDEIPGPVAEVEEGQDRPADDDIPSTTGGSTGGGGTTGTGSNDSDDGNGPVSDGEGRSTSGSSGNSTGGSSTRGGSTTSGSSTSGGSSSSGGSTSTGGSSSGSTGGRTSGGSSGSTSGGTTTGGGETESTSGSSSSSSSSSSSTTTTGSSSSGTSSGTSTTSTSTTGGTSSESSTSSGSTTGGFLDSSSGV